MNHLNLTNPPGERPPVSWMQAMHQNMDASIRAAPCHACGVKPAYVYKDKHKKSGLVKYVCKTCHATSIMANFFSSAIANREQFVAEYKNHFTEPFFWPDDTSQSACDRTATAVAHALLPKPKKHAAFTADDDSSDSEPHPNDALQASIKWMDADSSDGSGVESATTETFTSFSKRPSMTTVIPSLGDKSRSTTVVGSSNVEEAFSQSVSKHSTDAEDLTFMVAQLRVEIATLREENRLLFAQRQLPKATQPKANTYPIQPIAFNLNSNDGKTNEMVTMTFFNQAMERLTENLAALIKEQVRNTLENPLAMPCNSPNTSAQPIYTAVQHSKATVASDIVQTPVQRQDVRRILRSADTSTWKTVVNGWITPSSVIHTDGQRSSTVTTTDTAIPTSTTSASTTAKTTSKSNSYASLTAQRLTGIRTVVDRNDPTKKTVVYGRSSIMPTNEEIIRAISGATPSLTKREYNRLSLVHFKMAAIDELPVLKHTIKEIFGIEINCIRNAIHYQDGWELIMFSEKLVELQNALIQFKSVFSARLISDSDELNQEQLELLVSRYSQRCAILTTEKPFLSKNAIPEAMTSSYNVAYKRLIFLQGKLAAMTRMTTAILPHRNQARRDLKQSVNEENLLKCQLQKTLEAIKTKENQLSLCQTREKVRLAQQKLASMNSSSLQEKPIPAISFSFAPLTKISQKARKQLHSLPHTCKRSRPVDGHSPNPAYFPKSNKALSNAEEYSRLGEEPTVKDLFETVLTGPTNASPMEAVQAE